MEELIKQLTEAIEQGKGTNWGYNGEDEYEYDTFETKYALSAVLKVVYQSQLDMLDEILKGQDDELQHIALVKYKETETLLQSLYLE